ncbi:MAG TPA: alpha-amylase family protein [Tepidisphaeraceae bacterium]|nr:alpha-amylase family protein [Tepidisphaeraceae bacterium]
MARQQSPLPYRQIHLDFHTSPKILDVGADFDARQFARTMKAAHVNSVTVFAKCHHGHLYYNTKRPERHPGLKKGLDLLGEQVDALHREGIRAPIYISVQCDEYAANTHPEWVARNPDSSQVKWAHGVDNKVFGAGWQILDMNTPYQEFLAEQTAEVLRLFKPVDGIFFDMCWNQPTTTQFAIDAMRRKNLNPEVEADRARHAHEVSMAYMKRFYDQVKASAKNAGVYFNGRPLHNLAEEIAYQGQVEIEALPTGGWGYMYFPKNVRFARNFGKEYLGMTARFHKSWADFGGLKPYAALEYETSQMMAHGAKCSVGDQLHPRGTTDRAAYELIGAVYARVEEREPWLDGAEAVTQIGLFQTPAGKEHMNVIQGVDEGATRLLTQLKHQFNVVDEHSDWQRYDLLVLPDIINVTPSLAKKLVAYVKGGGKVLASGTSGLNAEGTEVLLPFLGIKANGPSPYKATYIRFGRELSDGVPPTDHVMYDRGLRVRAASGGKAVATVVQPYFERAWDHFCSHNQTPGDRVSGDAAAVVTDSSAYVSYNIFGAFNKHGNYPYRLLVKNLIDRLLPDPLLRIVAPTSTEATVMRQRNRTIVHLLQYTPERRTKDLDIVEDIVPLYDVPISLRLDKAPKRVYIAPDNDSIDFRYEDGRATLQVPEVRGHAMVVFG